jgi:hypothetical protein
VPLLPLVLSPLHSGLDWPVSGLIPKLTFVQFAAGLLFDPEDGGDVLPKRGAFFELFGVIPHSHRCYNLKSIIIRKIQLKD